jgi:hypothetical protein
MNSYGSFQAMVAGEGQNIGGGSMSVFNYEYRKNCGEKIDSAKKTQDPGYALADELNAAMWADLPEEERRAMEESTKWNRAKIERQTRARDKRMAKEKAHPDYRGSDWEEAHLGKSDKPEGWTPAWTDLGGGFWKDEYGDTHGYSDNPADYVNPAYKTPAQQEEEMAAARRKFAEYEAKGWV